MATSNLMPFMGNAEQMWGGAGMNVMPGGQNQYMSYPGLPNFNATGPVARGPVPGGGSSGGGTSGGLPPGTQFGTPTQMGGNPNFPGLQFQNYWGTGYPEGSTTPYPVGNTLNLGGSVYTAPTMSPTYTGEYYNLLQQLMSPTAGGAVTGDFLSFLTGGQSSTPGATQLAQMATTGNPFNVSPEWQSMVAQQQQNIQQNQANLKEQFGAAGELQSSPFGTAMSNYEQQTTLDQNALLAQLQQQSYQQAQQNQLQAGGMITGLAGNEQQYLNSLFSQGALTSPNLYNPIKGSLIGGIGSLIGAGASLGGMSTGGGGTLAGDLLSFLGLA